MNSVEVGVTHQIKIGREEAWVKVGVSLDKESHETIEYAIDRASKIVNKKIVDVIETTVDTVHNYERNQK